MNYPESHQILEEIKKAKKILVNCHRGPDSDSVGSALAFRDVLKNLGKDVVVICPSEVPEDLLFLEGSGDIQQKIDFSKFNFSDFDLFILIDSSTYGMASGDNSLKRPPLRMVVIDHHYTNEGFGDLNLIDSKCTSTSELLYKIFSDLNFTISKSTADDLLTGILGDTGAFQYSGVGRGTLEIAGKLIGLGADKDKIVFNIYRSINFKTVKFWGEVISSMQLDNKNRFVWSAIPYNIYKKYGEDPSAKEDGANLFFPIIKDSDFGFIMVETKENYLSISFRSRSDFDVSKVAMEIGGGGHKAAAGAKIENLPFDKAVEKVLEVARKYARKD